MNNSPTAQQHVRDFLRTLGLTQEETKLYLTLLHHGQLTMLELSRLTEINRTKVYRTAEELCARGLAQEVIEENTTRLEAVPADRIAWLLKEQDNQLQELKNSYPQVQQYLNQVMQDQKSSTQVKFYRGQAGIHHMVWNSTKARGELLGYTYRSLASMLGEQAAEDIYEEFVVNQIHIRDMYSDHYLESIGGLENGTSTDRPGFGELVESRYLAPDVLDIDHQIDLYNDTMAVYNWHEGEIFGVEIHNPKVIKMQRQIFEVLWQVAVPEVELLRGLQK